ncbi:chromosome partitioning ATPase [Piscinibacter sp.]|uniref:chromosome partitioning ATPase n=1 Tax=Piscinibacter sp. TaxID=1903157 RepID=UPI0039E21817
MNIIEQATQRLEELKRAGIDIPWAAVEQAGAGAALKEATAAPANVIAHAAVPAPVRRDGPVLRSKDIHVDMARLAELGYIVPGRERSRWAEEFRAVKRAVLDVIRQPQQKTPRSNLLMVTSALPGDGKTFCALNLALSIAAEVDSSVMLVDADVVKPSVLDRLGVQAEAAGLLDVLSGSVNDLSEVLLKPDSIPKLTLLHAGMPRENATELLASGAMDRLLDELSTRYTDRIVVFDAPPLLLTSEAKALAKKVGQLLMVVRESVTRVEDLTNAYACVESVPNVISVLNGSPLEEAPQGYASGYGYAA